MHHETIGKRQLRNTSLMSLGFLTLCAAPNALSLSPDLAEAMALTGSSITVVGGIRVAMDWMRQRRLNGTPGGDDPDREAVQPTAQIIDLHAGYATELPEAEAA